MLFSKVFCQNINIDNIRKFWQSLIKLNIFTVVIDINSIFFFFNLIMHFWIETTTNRIHYRLENKIEEMCECGCDQIKINMILPGILYGD